MFLSKINSRYRKIEEKRICQGDIIKDIRIFTNMDDNESVNIESIFLEYCVVMTQDCDLMQDFQEREYNSLDNDKHLQTILICPAYLDGNFFDGNHLEGLSMRKFKASEQSKLKKNDEMKRYYYLQGDSKMQIPNLVVDFKHFFTLSRDYLYSKRKNNYVASINELFREGLSQRFANFLSRFGLPEIKE